MKIVEKRQTIMEGDEEKKEEGEDIAGDILEEGFVGFEDDEKNQFKNLLASSDEDDEDELEKIKIDRNRSNHELLMVIIESIEDTFDLDYKKTKWIVTVLREESEGSLEVKLARKKIISRIKTSEDLSKTEVMRLVAINRGIYKGGKKLSVEKLKKFAEFYKAEFRVSMLEIFAEVLDSIKEEEIEEFNTYVDELASKCKVEELEKASLMNVQKLIVTFFAVFSNKSLIVFKKFVEEHKFLTGMFKIYILCFGEKLSEAKKLEYLTNYLQKSASISKKDISSFQKVEIQKMVITEVVEFLG